MGKQVWELRGNVCVHTSFSEGPLPHLASAAGRFLSCSWLGGSVASSRPPCIVPTHLSLGVIPAVSALQPHSQQLPSFHPFLSFPPPGCIAVTSAEDGGAETTQYLILQGPDDGKGARGVFQWWISLLLSLFPFWQWVHSNGGKQTNHGVFFEKVCAAGGCSQRDVGQGWGLERTQPP